MPRAAEDIGERFADLRFVVDDEDRRAASGSRAATGTASARVRYRQRRTGSVIVNTAPPFAWAIDGQRAAMRFDDAEAHRQSDAECRFRWAWW